VCVPNLEEAVEWYTGTLGLVLLSPPTRIEGRAIEEDMGEMIPGIVLKAAILGVPDSGDRVLEVLEYPRHPGRPRSESWSLTDHGFSHVGLVCEDIAATRAHLESRGVRFLTHRTAEISGLETAWFEDPYGNVFILMEKTAKQLPYFRQWQAGGDMARSVPGNSAAGAGSRRAPPPRR
jgi:catechol 2,3-dioxygenase-like lactoylglutathione lyase family enzyme